MFLIIIFCTVVISIQPVVSFQQYQKYTSCAQNYRLDPSTQDIPRIIQYYTTHHTAATTSQYITSKLTQLNGWVQDSDGEWSWKEDDPNSDSAIATETLVLNADSINTQATPSLPAGAFRPKQSLGQNYLRDGNTVAKIVKAFVSDATSTLQAGVSSSAGEEDSNEEEEENILKNTDLRAVELGPGAGALTDVLLPALGHNNLQCIEIDDSTPTSTWSQQLAMH